MHYMSPGTTLTVADVKIQDDGLFHPVSKHAKMESVQACVEL